VKISRSGATWSPWSTYPLRAAAYMPAATAAAGAFLANPSTAAQYVEGAAGAVSDATGVGALAQGVTEAVQTPIRIMNWLTEPGTWVRISLFGLGAAMLIGGAILFVRPAAESAAGGVMKVLPTGKVGALVGAVSKGVK